MTRDFWDSTFHTWDNALRAEHAYEDLAKQAAKDVENLTSDTGEAENGKGRLAIYTIPGTKYQYVQADRAFEKGRTQEEWAENTERFINDMIEREGYEGKLYIKTVENDYIEITSKTAWKVVDMYQRSRNGTQAHKLSSKLYDAKTNAALHIDELVQIAKNQTKRNGHATDYGNRHDADGFTYRDVFFRDYDGEYYLLTISIMESNVKNEAYSIGKIDRRTTPQRKSGSSDRTAGARGDSSSIEANNNTNTQTSQGFSENSSKNRGSISDKVLKETDSTGKKLSEGQRSFFAGSKVLDENGNLLKAYHGTNGGDFYTFDWAETQRADGGFYGRGFYFTPFKGEAEAYGKRLFEVYLNITNPL